MRQIAAQHIHKSLVRQKMVLVLVCLSFLALTGKLVFIQLFGHDKLVAEAKERHIRTVQTLPIRGPIYDRNDRLLAVSTPIDAVWADAKVFCADLSQAKKVFGLLKVSKPAFKKSCDQRAKANFSNNFMFIKRQVPPVLAQRVKALAVPGLHLQRSYKRFYPQGPATAHLIGFTNIDGKGQEGIEKSYDINLRGAKGEQVVHRDSKGRFVEFVEQVEATKNGHKIQLSIDSRLQYLISGYLEQAVRNNKARGGSAVLIYAPTGEILSIVDSPQFNPNDRRSLTPDRIRNRAVSDVQEPGSTVKPFTIATALESGIFTADSTIDTGQVPFKVRGGTISDTHPHGELTLAEIVVKSSNIGAAKLAMKLSYDEFYDTFDRLGFGHKVNVITAEVSGVLPKRERMIERMTQAYGYGLNATPLQVARAYTVFANKGVLKPLSIKKLAPNTHVAGKRVFSQKTTNDVLKMLEMVATPEGTARLAQIDRYRVGGKTGTSIRNSGNGYEKGHYVSWFVGMAPMSDPKYVLAVMVDDPRAGKYYGGTIAGPIFAKSMQDVMRLFNVAPDKFETQFAQKNKHQVGQQPGGST